MVLARPILAESPERTRTLRFVYFDTTDHVLRDSGLLLTLLQEGRVWRQIVSVKSQDGGIDPDQLEAALGSGEPDFRLASGPIGERLRALVGNEPLAAQFETVIRRTIRQIAATGGGAVEAVFDEGDICAEGTALDVREARFELKSGDAATLLSVVADLLGDMNFRFSTESQAERGYRLLCGESAAQAAPEKSDGQPLAEGESTVEAFAAACHSATRQILHNWDVVIDTSDPEGPHQLRIGLRRLRTALRAFRPAIDSPDLRQLARGQ